ncbi:MAG: YigZ family protein [Caldisericia bacterium]|nr:YigZ family protein [Caldisericia bacterium]
MKRNLLIQDGEFVLQIKKSLFYAFTFRILSDEDFFSSLLTLKKNYKNATHYCYAFRIQDLSNHTLEKMTDDGEPYGTAGIPLLSLLQSHCIANGAIVVVRYFGGIKLGKKGLYSAYLDVAKKSLLDAKIEEYIPKEVLDIAVQYTVFDRFERICKKYESHFLQVDYGEVVKVKLEIASNDKMALIEAFSQANIVKYVIIQ